MNEETIVEAKELVKRFAPKGAPPVTALSGIDISLQTGCLTAIIIGIPFSLRTGRKGPALAIASSIALFIALYMLSHIALYMGIRGVVPPILAAWLPNLAFLFLGLALLPTVR